jgi:ribosome-associated translation inhibitor RaiA
MRTKPITLPPPRLVVDGDFGVDIADLVVAKLSRLTRHASGPILDVRVRLVRHPHPMAEPPVEVEVEVNVDLNGRPVRAIGAAHGVRDALDQVVGRLVRQLDARPVRHRGRGAHRR